MVYLLCWSGCRKCCIGRAARPCATACGSARPSRCRRSCRTADTCAWRRRRWRGRRWRPRRQWASGRGRARARPGPRPRSRGSWGRWWMRSWSRSLRTWPGGSWASGASEMGNCFWELQKFKLKKNSKLKKKKLN